MCSHPLCQATNDQRSTKQLSRIGGEGIFGDGDELSLVRELVAFVWQKCSRTDGGWLSSAAAERVGINAPVTGSGTASGFSHV